MTQAIVIPMIEPTSGAAGRSAGTPSVAIDVADRGSFSAAVGTSRDVSVDYLKSTIILLVVAHHSALAYTTFSRFKPSEYLASTAPVVDSQRWIALDLLVNFNDIFFMSLMFFVSGLFVWPSLIRKGEGRFLRDRALRLGLPFIVVVATLIPLAYYPSYWLAGGTAHYLEYWRESLRNGWPSGPTWFVWMLLLFNLAAALLHRAVPGMIEALARAAARAARRPELALLVVVALTALTYIPLRLMFGPFSWVRFGGPLWFQASRFMLYSTYFLAGVCIGAHGLKGSLLASGGSLERHWRPWALSALAMYFVVSFGARTFAAPDGGATRDALYGFLFILSCGLTTFAFLALFRRFATRPFRILDNLSENSYAIYLIHYVFVIWLQFWMLGLALPTPFKFLIVFSGALSASWCVSEALRLQPSVRAIV